MTKPKALTAYQASRSGDCMTKYWNHVQMMVHASAEDLIRVYGPNCFIPYEYIISPEGFVFLRGPVNQYVHTPASP